MKYLACLLLLLPSVAVAQNCPGGVCYGVPVARPLVATQRVITRAVSRPVYALPTFGPVVESRALLSDADLTSAVAAAVASEKVKADGAMRGLADGDREVGRRLVLRLQLKRLQRRGVDVDSIRTILNDDEKFELLYQGAKDQYGDPAVTGPYIESIQSFLQWLIDNQDSILALITKIISLFSEAQPVSVGAAVASPFPAVVSDWYPVGQEMYTPATYRVRGVGPLRAFFGRLFRR